MADNRDMQALDYDPAYNKSQYLKDYQDIKTKGKIEKRPDVQPHHIRGLNNYHRAFSHLSPENRKLLQDELRPFGLVFGNDKANLVGVEGQWSRSEPGKTRYGGQHSLMHKRQEDAMQKMGFDRHKASYTGVAGIPWKQMSQEQIMSFLRAAAIKDEMTMNETLSTALPLKTKGGAMKLHSNLEAFQNRLTSQTDAISTVFQAQGSSIEEAAEVSRNTTDNREKMAAIARTKGGLFGTPDLGISEILAGKSFIRDERQVYSKNGSIHFKNRLVKTP